MTFIIEVDVNNNDDHPQDVEKTIRWLSMVIDSTNILVDGPQEAEPAITLYEDIVLELREQAHV